MPGRDNERTSSANTRSKKSINVALSRTIQLVAGDKKPAPTNKTPIVHKKKHSGREHLIKSQSRIQLNKSLKHLLSGRTSN